MPSDHLILEFNLRTGDIVRLMSAGDFDAALQAVHTAEEELQEHDDDGWLRRSCLGMNALVHQENGSLTEALASYRELEKLSAPASEYMVTQLGIARVLLDMRSPTAAAQAIENGLALSEQSIPTALALLRLYAEAAGAMNSNVPLRWADVYQKACATLGVEPRGFDVSDPHSFTTAIHGTPVEKPR